MNELSTTRVTDNGPLRIVDRKGTATIYLNPAGGASFEDLDSFRTGTPVLTAALRHQVILDTLNGNTIIVNFDLTITAAEIFTVGAIKHRLGRPGQKMTWTAYGRPNTSATQPGQFVFAGMGFSHVPAPLGLSIHRPTGSGAIQLERENGRFSTLALRRCFPKLIAKRGEGQGCPATGPSRRFTRLPPCCPACGFQPHAVTKPTPASGRSPVTPLAALDSRRNAGRMSIAGVSPVPFCPPFCALRGRDGIPGSGNEIRNTTTL